MKALLISIWFCAVSLGLIYLLANHGKMVASVDSCQRQQKYTQADIKAFAAHQMELASEWRWFKNSLNLAVGD